MFSIFSIAFADTFLVTNHLVRIVIISNHLQSVVVSDNFIFLRNLWTLNMFENNVRHKVSFWEYKSKISTQFCLGVTGSLIRSYDLS